jgi:glycosyltransferase involved in cell wall biosynthesis
MIRVLHVITDLDVGGAEIILARLLSRLDKRELSSFVVGIIQDGQIGERIRSLGIPVVALGFKPGIPDPRIISSLFRVIRRQKPDVVHAWMYHACLAAGMAARLIRSVPVVWGIHHTNLDLRCFKLSTAVVARISGLLSRSLSARVLINSHLAGQVHEKIGFDSTRMVFVPNGFDLDDLKPSPTARDLLRRELGLSPETPLIGMVARFDPQKDHRTFVCAAGLLHQSRPDVHYVMCGKGITRDNPSLMRWCLEAGIGNVAHLLGLRANAPALTAALDIASLSSAGESFPNVIGEAMACEIPCVATDVGDCREIIGETGLVVPPREPALLAAAWEKLLAMPSKDRKELGKMARMRIQEHYNLDTMARRHEALYRELEQSRS